MGNTGRLLFWGRSIANGLGVRPYVWDPFNIGQPNPFGTFDRTTELGYEAFCCGQALMADGKVLIAGTNFGPEPIGEPPHQYYVPGPNVSVLNPDTLVWDLMPPEFELQRSRYYPSVTRMPGPKPPLR